VILLVASRALCMGGAVGPILRVLTAAPGENVHMHMALATSLVFGAWVFHREIAQERAARAREEE
jgi:hypothetical protein